MDKFLLLIAKKSLEQNFCCRALPIGTNIPGAFPLKGQQDSFAANAFRPAVCAVGLFLRNRKTNSIGAS